MSNVNFNYVLTMLAAVFAAGWLSVRRQSQLALTRRQRLGIALGAFCGGMIGAKLPFVLSDWEGLLTGRAWLENGKTITFGFVGGYFGVEIAKSICNVRIKTGDTFAVPVAVAVAIGRLSCFQAGCCFGTPTALPWGVNFGDGILRHPTQIYEAFFHVAAAGVLAVLQHRGLFRGQLIKLYFIAYFAYRFASEFIRPEPRIWLELTGYQWASLAFIPLFAALWWHDARAKQTV